MRCIDANFILRYLLGDPQAEKAENVLKREKSLFMPEIVFAEVIWTFTSFYKWGKRDICDALARFLLYKNVRTDRKLLFHALDIYRENNIDYIDAFIAAVMFKKKFKEIYTFDKHFDKIKGIRRLEPK